MSAPPTALAGLILAAGASSRMGRPKPLLPLPTGETFLDRLIALLSPHCSPVIVVLGHGAAEIRDGIRLANAATFVLNPDYASGQLSSFQCGLRAVPPGAPGVMFTPADYPSISPDTVARLASAFLHGRAPLVVPRCGGRHGHPVCCARELIPEFLGLPAGSQAREIVHRHSADTLYLDVDDPGILRDIDNPEAYRDLTRGAPRP